MASLKGMMSFGLEGTVESSTNLLSKIGLVSRGKQSTHLQRLDGKVVIITGANRGLGKEAAKELAKLGARLIFGCRDVAVAQEAAVEIAKVAPEAPKVTIHKLDLSSIESINYFAQIILDTETTIDILINNAGLIATTQRTTSDGHEMNFGTNHLGPFLLTLLLLERIKQSSQGKIIFVGSAAALYVNTINFENLDFKKNWDYMAAYGQSKLANILTTQELAGRLPANVHTYVIDPGFVKTDLFRENPQMMQLPVLSNLYKLGMKGFQKLGCRTPAQGAASIVYCAASQEAENETGLYYGDCKPKKPAKHALDKELALNLWRVSCDMVGLPLFKEKMTL